MVINDRKIVYLRPNEAAAVGTFNVYTYTIPFLTYNQLYQQLWENSNTLACLYPFADLCINS